MSSHCFHIFVILLYQKLVIHFPSAKPVLRSQGMHCALRPGGGQPVK